MFNVIREWIQYERTAKRASKLIDLEFGDQILNRAKHMLTRLSVSGMSKDEIIEFLDNIKEVTKCYGCGRITIDKPVGLKTRIITFVLTVGTLQ